MSDDGSRRRIWQLMLRHRKSYARGLVLLVLVNAAGLATAGLLKLIFDALGHEGGAAVAGWAALVIAVLAAFRALARTGSRLAILGNSRKVCAELERSGVPNKSGEARWTPSRIQGILKRANAA